MSTRQPALRLADPGPPASRIAPSRHHRLTSDEIHAVVRRNSDARVHHPLPDGVIRTARVRYVRDGSALYIPAWTALDAWYEEPVPVLECEVTEVDWHSCWRHVRLRGPATPLQPTGARPERDLWRHGVVRLRSVVASTVPIDDLALANFGIVRMMIDSWDGAVARWSDDTLSPMP